MTADIKQLEKLIEEGENLKEKYPDNFAISMSVYQDKCLLAKLLKEQEKSIKKKKKKWKFS